MRHYYRFIICALMLCSNVAYAHELFLEGIEWHATETNDWAYVNSETVPQQTLTYKTINFNYAPGFRIGARYVRHWDLLFSYTRFYTSASDAATGNIQPAFAGSVTAKPSHAYLYPSGQVRQNINYNIFDLDFGKAFYPLNTLMLHPMVGLMGGWINQTIQANFQGSTAASEKITNNFSGIGPKIGIDTDITLLNYCDFQAKLIASFAASYLVGSWVITDVTHATPSQTILVTGSNHSMGALTLQGMLGIKLEYKKFAAKFAYEMSDWFNQNQFFDNDTGTHNNDLILQGLTLGLSYGFD